MASRKERVPFKIHVMWAQEAEEGGSMMGWGIGCGWGATFLYIFFVCWGGGLVPYFRICYLWEFFGWVPLLIHSRTFIILF